MTLADQVRAALAEGDLPHLLDGAVALQAVLHDEALAFILVQELRSAT